MDVSYNFQGYDLYEITLNEWIFHDKGRNVYHGTLVEMGVLAVNKFGFDIDQIDFATKMMLKLNHNGAHFGVNKTFIFSFEKEFGDAQAS